VDEIGIPHKVEFSSQSREKRDVKRGEAATWPAAGMRRPRGLLHDGNRCNDGAGDWRELDLATVTSLPFLPRAPREVAELVVAENDGRLLIDRFPRFRPPATADVISSSLVSVSRHHIEEEEYRAICTWLQQV
jgi:hypothetical protein